MRRDRRLDVAETRLARLRLPERVEDRFGKYKEDPVRFCKEALGVKSATRRSTGSAYQFEVLADLAMSPRVILRSGHGVGKTGVDAFAMLWWLCTRPLSRVVVLAPEYSRQIRAVIFSEARKWTNRAKIRLPIQVLASRILVEGYGEEWSATGMSTAGQADRLEGFHAEGGVLVICDETKGIPQESFDAVQGALTGLEDNRLLVTSVPGGAQGPFYKSWAHGGAAWVRHHVPSTDSSLVDPTWVEDRRREWGEGSPLFETRVLGNFASAGEGVLFPLALLEAATARKLEAPSDAAVTLGVDVARSVAGDRNVIAASRGGTARIATSWHSADTMKVVARVCREVIERNPTKVRVDVGGVGAGVVDRLRQLGAPVEAVNFGGGANDPNRFANRRAELFWLLREGLDRGEVALAEDDELVADLAVMRYDFDARGRILLEPKEEIRRKLGRSPDRGDALALAACGGIRGAGRGWKFNKVEVGPSGVRVLDQMPLIAYAFGLEPCGDPVSGEGRGPDALEQAQAYQKAVDEAREAAAGSVRIVRA